MQKRETQHFLATYRDGELSVYLDGENRQTSNVRGDFRNWEEFPFLLGDEAVDPRPWKGQIHGFALHDRFFEPRAALERYRLASKERPED